MVVKQQADPAGYDQLRQRAVLFVREHGGAVLEESLIAHVFGSSSNPALWRPLLRQVLAADEQISLRSDGYWSLPNLKPENASTFQLLDHVVIDVETTGLKPYSQRVIEVAAIRYQGGVRQDVFTTLINPERRLPAYIARLTGIDEIQLNSAPTFNLVADQLVRFIDDHLIVGYNVGFDISFINAELKRLGKPPLINQRLDLLPLAGQILAGIRKPGLDGLCRALDIDHRERHRALGDAEATALVCARLFDVARERGLSTIESLQRAASVEVPTPKRRGAVGRGRAVLDRSHLADIPKRPGVYLMRDAHNRVIYVGKAKNLRNRVSSYYSQPLGYTRKMDGLLESIARIETVETGSELEALLLESQFILRYQPQFNRQQRNSESYPYIKVDVTNPWPRVFLTRQRKPDDAHYFGPFRVSRAAKVAVDLIHEVFPLRSCSRSFKTARSYGSPCLELSLGRCPGPCVGQADRDLYRKTVYDVISFLRGEQGEAIDRLHEQLEEAAERLDFERAARLRDRLRRVQELIISQQLLEETIDQGNLLIITPSPEPGARQVLLVLHGRLWAQLHVFDDDPDDDVQYRLKRAWTRGGQQQAIGVDQDSLDQVHILGRWLRKHTGHPAILPLGGETAEPDWPSLVRVLRELDDSALSLEPITTDDIPESSESDVVTP